MKAFITKNSKETQKLAQGLAGKMGKGTIIALEGDLGSGKTTFTQGLLKGLKVKGPYTSPTFVIIKQYKLIAHNAKRITQNKKPLRATHYAIRDIYHVDAYRVKARDILNLGWKEMIDQKDNIIIIEWADRIRKIIPKSAFWIKFETIEKNKRKMTFKNINR